MSRESRMNVLCKIVGKKNATRMQSRLKYLLNFRKDYHIEKAPQQKIISQKVNRGGCKTYVFIVDGKTAHGGLSDRLRGCFSVYDYCKQRGYSFKIFWKYPDDLTNYFVPSQVDWIITSSEMIYDKSLVDFKFFNTYTMLQNDPDTYADLLDSNKSIVHVYTNLTMNEPAYAADFSALFKPSVILEKEISKNLEKIDGDFISITFRFIGCLGDFIDRPDLFPPLKTQEEKNEYIEACLNAITKLKKDNRDINRILVTADSLTFLKEASKLDYVYVIPGAMTHMDTTSDHSKYSQMKSFLDFILISKAKESYTYSYGKMFKGSKFARTAALVAGRNVIDLSQDEIVLDVGT